MALTGDPLTTVNTLTDRQDATGTTTSGSFTATLTGGTACGRAFVAPASGQVRIFNTLNGFNSGGAAFCGFEVRNGGVIGSGTVFQAAGDNISWIVSGGNSLAMTYTSVVGGLTPGASYNVRQMFRVSAGTGTYAWKELIVEGCA